jgi:hypothetical protein
VNKDMLEAWNPRKKTLQNLSSFIA